jgi:hypothetical protein
VSEIVGPHEVGVQLDATQVDDPDQSGRVIDYDLLGGAARRKSEGNRSQPLRPIRRCAFLVEGLAFGTIHEALENQRTVSDSAESTRRDGKKIANYIEF